MRFLTIFKLFLLYGGCIKAKQTNLFLKVWALASRKCGSDLFLVAGSAGGQLTTWRDVTESAVLQQQATAARTVVDQQKLANLLVSQQYGKALQLALRQEHLPQIHYYSGTILQF